MGDGPLVDHYSNIDMPTCKQAEKSSVSGVGKVPSPTSVGPQPKPGKDSSPHMLCTHNLCPQLLS